MMSLTTMNKIRYLLVKRIRFISDLTFNIQNIVSHQNNLILFIILQNL